MSETHPHFHPLTAASEALPDLFTFPFSYDPHPLSIRAAEQVKAYLQKQQDFSHNFGLVPGEDGLAIGKMFGVMVVKDKHGKLGFLAAVSGKLANSNQHAFFVPPVYDMLDEEGFFLKEEQRINEINREIAALKVSEEWLHARQRLQDIKKENEKLVEAARFKQKQQKSARKQIRENLDATLSESARAEILADLIKQSYRDQHEYNLVKQHCDAHLNIMQADEQHWQKRLNHLKEERKQRSSALQQKIFDQYQFLNAEGDIRSVLAIFRDLANGIPPAGAGECAAPKLFQYAYQHNFTPICMAEFWWGTSPSAEVRRHEQFYPSCRGKCEPILNFMMQGLAVEPNPLLQPLETPSGLDIIFEDDHFIVVNKPAELLSVPGIHIKDSVYTRILAICKDITGPVIIHRLDMSTSGIMLLAKHKEAHRHIQDQFIKHQVTKRYTALLDGIIPHKEGVIDLPLRVDLDDRPRQMVCYTHGKPAQTRYRVVEFADGKTRIHFFPLTGRTHQLRVHAAHRLGLHTPIMGDDLYGDKADRLHLHAGHIAFIHPASGEKLVFEVADPF
ncbi:pseudouridine synthase [Sphingobacterium sp. lm-10]|uniref:RluA family pseudouridine synthase n=1 Tax=Sphingobacterium sp. lm-10 TaxID=2944904 RepID=UPI0020211192|nr:RluA family pseudouridine synthase [Sphingobacterium sp. lm-10]MCL7986911.1 pseudouridine synthase [Sphingobacterium sp. lm-10]